MLTFVLILVVSLLVPVTAVHAQVTVGTFNLKWAFDEKEDRSPLADEQNADTAADWIWKRDIVAEILVEQNLDIVALQEIGGRREVEDLVAAIEAAGGPDYNWAFRKGTDTTTDQQVALLSRFRLHSWRRFNIRVSKHVAVEAEVPGVGDVTFIVAHLKAGGGNSDLRQRRRQARALKTETSEIVGDRPVVILGDFNTRGLPGGSDYANSAPGILTGADTITSFDDCEDSAEEPEARTTHLSGLPFDRIIACGIGLSGNAVVAESDIQRGQADPFNPNSNWSSVPTDSAPHRDVSDHFVLRANLNASDAQDGIRERLLERIDALQLELSELREMVEQLIEP